jgi:hypothetical protein
MAAHVTRQVSPRMGLALRAPSAMDLKVGARMPTSFRMGYAVGGVGSNKSPGNTGVRPVAERAGYTTFGSAQRGHLESRGRRDAGLDLLGVE